MQETASRFSNGEQYPSLAEAIVIDVRFYGADTLLPVHRKLLLLQALMKKTSSVMMQGSSNSSIHIRQLMHLLLMQSSNVNP